MTTVVMIREQLEDRELANFLPLPCPWDLRVVTSTRPGRYAATSLGVPTTHLRQPRQRLARLPVAAQRRAMRRQLPSGKDWDELTGVGVHLPAGSVAVVNETHMASSAQVARIRAERDDLRLVAVCYENIPFRYEEDARLARRKDYVREAVDLFVTMTPTAEDCLVLEGVPRDRIATVPFGVRADHFHEKRSTHRKFGHPGDIVFIFTGRLLREKGLVEFLVAMRDVTLAWHLVLVGSGDEAIRLRRAAAALGILDKLSFVPWAEPAAIPGLLAEADVFVMPSLPTPYWHEQLGYSMIEAMAAGLPVLAVDSGSNRFIAGEGALLVAPYQLPALTRAATTLCERPDLRAGLGAAGRGRVVRDLNCNNVARMLSELFGRLYPELPNSG